MVPSTESIVSKSPTSHIKIVYTLEDLQLALLIRGVVIKIGSDIYIGSHIIPAGRIIQHINTNNTIKT